MQITRIEVHGNIVYINGTLESRKWVSGSIVLDNKDHVERTDLHVHCSGRVVMARPDEKREILAAFAFVEL